MDRRRSILNHLMETWRSIKCKLLGILFKLFKEVSTMIFWGAGGAHKKNRQLWIGFVCPLILAHYNAQCCPHTVELLTNLREFHSARRRGEGPQYGPSWFFLGLLGASSGLLGAFSANSHICVVHAEAAVVYSELLIRAVCCQISPTCLTGRTVKLSGHFCSGFYFILLGRKHTFRIFCYR